MNHSAIVVEGLRAAARIAEGVVSLLREVTYVALGMGVVAGEALLDAGRRLVTGRASEHPPHKPRKAA
jgi:hypothetical protein